MFENSPAGIFLLAADVSVTVTREEDHQRVLTRYSVAPGAQRSVAVTLAWCTIGAGKHRGEQAIEVLLDGYRVGELTYLMSQRYADLVRQVEAAGDVPGCAAVIERTDRGLQITLRLPKDTQRVVPLATQSPRTATERIVPVVPKRSRRTSAWIVAGAVVFLLVVFGAIIGSGEDPEPVGAPATETTTTYEPPPTTTTRTTTRTTTIPPTTIPVTTTTTVPAPPPPPPVTQEPVAPPPPVVEEPPSQCDPNYSGCVPIAPDVDCAGGSGNGPAYVEGPVQVVGSDIYDLDRDGNGVACE